jgi:hypothetical protein
LLSAEVLYHRFGKSFVKNSYDVTEASKHYHVATRFRKVRRKLIDRITAEWKQGEQFAISQVDILAIEYLGIGRKVQKDWDWFLR